MGIKKNIYEIIKAVFYSRFKKDFFKEIYNNIYDKTEGFEIKIEPWLSY